MAQHLNRKARVDGIKLSRDSLEWVFNDDKHEFKFTKKLNMNLKK